MHRLDFHASSMTTSRWLFDEMVNGAAGAFADGDGGIDFEPSPVDHRRRR
jgi:hypothetical protein